MDKRCYLIIAKLLLLLGLSTAVLAADSCQDYSGDAKNICTSVANAKADFYKKYSMDAANPVQKQLTSSCNNLSGIEKDTCLTKNNFVDQHILANSANSTPPTPAPTTMEESKPQAAMQETPPTNSDISKSEEAVGQPAVSTKNSSVNIFNN